jgi:hypothetical protein
LQTDQVKAGLDPGGRTTETLAGFEAIFDNSVGKKLHPRQLLDAAGREA